MKNSSIIALLLLGASIVSCGEKKTAPAMQDEIIPVKTMPLSQESGGGKIDVSGQFTTDDETFLSFKTGGVINHIYVQEGQAVKAGQLLATLNLTEVGAQAQQAQLGVEKARRDFDRAQSLYRDSVATLEQLQNARTALDLVLQQLNAAQFNRNFSEIRAVKDGYILRKLMNDGQVVSSGTPVLQANGASSGKWLLRVGVSDHEWAKIRLQDKATVSVSSVPGKAFDGYVFRRSEGVDPATGTFTIDIKVNNTVDGQLASGLFGKASIQTAAGNTSAPVWRIPYDALLDGDGNTGNVFITSDNKTAHKVPVILAGMEKNEVLISGGLEQAGALIISGSAYLTDSSHIRIIQ